MVRGEVEEGGGVWDFRFRGGGEKEGRRRKEKFEGKRESRKSWAGLDLKSGLVPSPKHIQALTMFGPAQWYI